MVNSRVSPLHDDGTSRLHWKWCHGIIDDVTVSWVSSPPMPGGLPLCIWCNPGNYAILLSHCWPFPLELPFGQRHSLFQLISRVFNKTQKLSCFGCHLHGWPEYSGWDCQLNSPPRFGSSFIGKFDKVVMIALIKIQYSFFVLLVLYIPSLSPKVHGAANGKIK